ncbi:hypothetical protein DMQ72_09710 [Klebsiella quasipneumoniae]|nr:hypothetical protein DMQ72_09710 [Klebsiella quasipneumoniae]
MPPSKPQSAGWRLTPYPAYGPTGGRGTRRPGKRSAAGQSTAERVLVFMPDGGCALSGLQSNRRPRNP